MFSWLITKKGFTLIELLIVVAIIGILAGIAIPNFLNAQIRSKVSRCQAEMATLATSLESYAVDNTAYPRAWQAQPGMGIGWQTPDMMPTYQLRLIPLTTPIAYISKLPKDIFNPGSDRSTIDWSDNGQDTYVYFTSESDDILHLYSSGVFPTPSWVEENQSAKWRLASYGPARKRYFSGTNYVREGQIGLVANMYDPTNGTISNGFVCRFGP